MKLKPGQLCIIVGYGSVGTEHIGRIVTLVSSYSSDGLPCWTVADPIPGYRGIAERAMRPINDPDMTLDTTKETETV